MFGYILFLNSPPQEVMHFLQRFLFLALVLFLCSAPLQGGAKASKKRKRATAYEVDVFRNVTPPTLDGILSKNEWKNASIITNFTQKEPNEGEPASEPTIILVYYDDEHVYFGIRCFDREPDRIVANAMRRDSDLSDNDYVEIIIDTFHDQRNAYYFATNSLGARLDSEIKAEGTHINWQWDGIWFSAARRDQYGWTAEVAIPFKTLRFENSGEMVWGINFGRYIARKREESYWSPITRDDDFDNYGRFRVSKFGTLRGFRNIRQKERFQIKPYVIGGVERFAASGLNQTDKLANIGLDAKIGITSNLVSDLTINTDFAQVEADQEQVNLSRFNLFFPEKRDFFLEGLDIFNIGENVLGDPFTLLFFSRRIGLQEDFTTGQFFEVPIIAGVKLTGKEGPFELGFLDVLTEASTFTNYYGEVTSVPKTNFAAVRVKRDIFKRSYIGFMGLSKDQIADDGGYNRTVAVDGLFAFDNNLTVSGYLAKTFTPGLKGKDYNGFLDVSWGNDKFYSRASYTDIGENFNPEMGFLQWTDIRKYTLSLGVSPRPRFLNLKQTDFTYDLEYITDHSGELQYRTLSTGVLNIFRDHSYFYVGFINFYDNLPFDAPLEQTVIPAGIYRYNIFGVSYSSDLSRKISGRVDFSGGSFYDGTIYGVTLTNYLRPNDRFRFSLTFDWNRVDLPFENGRFNTAILGTRFTYSFTPNLYTRAYIQWNHFDKRVLSNILFNFIHTPGSDLYFVYNEEWDTRSGLQVRNRTFLAKFTYLLSF